MKRTCKKCSEEKELEEFTANKQCKYGRTHKCIDCAKIMQAEWYQKNIEIRKAKNIKWHSDNKQRSKELNKKYYNLNREKEIKKSSKWRKENPDKRKRIDKRYYLSHPEKIKEKTAALTEKKRIKRLFEVIGDEPAAWVTE